MNKYPAFSYNLSNFILVHFYFIIILAAQSKNDMYNKAGHHGHHGNILLLGRP